MSKQNGTVTIKSIAESLGVSFSTVSKALNGDPNVSDRTRILVEEKAKELNYTRNYFARTLRQQSSKTVAIIINDFDIPAYGNMITSIAAKLATYGYTTMVSDALYSEEFERNSIKTMLSRMPEAVIISLANPTGENLQLLSSLFPRTLVLGDVTGVEGANFVAVDHRLAGWLSANHMLSCGNYNNLIFGGPKGYQSSDRFLIGVREAYEAHNVPLSLAAIHRFPPDGHTAYRLFMHLWQENPGACEGVICFCDSMAFNVYRAARQLDLQIGKDISVIGYDDNPTLEFMSPPLTTIHIPNDLMAFHCSQFVIDRLISGNTQPYTYQLLPYLVDRGSVRKKNG